MFIRINGVPAVPGSTVARGRVLSWLLSPILEPQIWPQVFLQQSRCRLAFLSLPGEARAGPQVPFPAWRGSVPPASEHRIKEAGIPPHLLELKVGNPGVPLALSGAGHVPADLASGPGVQQHGLAAQPLLQAARGHDVDLAVARPPGAEVRQLSVALLQLPVAPQLVAPALALLGQQVGLLHARRQGPRPPGVEEPRDLLVLAAGRARRIGPQTQKGSCGDSGCQPSSAPGSSRMWPFGPKGVVGCCPPWAAV